MEKRGKRGAERCFGTNTEVGQKRSFIRTKNFKNVFPAVASGLSVLDVLKFLLGEKGRS